LGRAVIEGSGGNIPRAWPPGLPGVIEPYEGSGERLTFGYHPAVSVIEPARAKDAPEDNIDYLDGPDREGSDRGFRSPKFP
jgi:hypothetical protein